jgi:hypothetical protein
MTAFLARLDGQFIAALSSAWTTFLIWLAERAIALDDQVSKLEARWQARAETQRTPHVAAHRLRGRARPFDRADYEWGQALKAWASRTEGQYLQWQ